jgi:hypothetical protein
MNKDVFMKLCQAIVGTGIEPTSKVLPLEEQVAFSCILLDIVLATKPCRTVFSIVAKQSQGTLSSISINLSKC